MLCVSSSVAAPMRAEASAASVPAWPPPTTTTSNDFGNSILCLLCDTNCREPGSTASLGGRAIRCHPTVASAASTPSGRGAKHFGVRDAVLEIRPADRNEGELPIEALEPGLSRDPDSA